MAITVGYTVEYSSSYGSNLIPRVAKSTRLDGGEASVSYPNFEEVSALAPEVAIEFLVEFKKFLISASESITPEEGFEGLTWAKASTIEAAAIYVAERTTHGLDD